MPIVVRGARAADIAAIVEIERASFADPWRDRSFRDLLALSHIDMLVAEDDAAGDIVGYAVVIVVATEAELANIAVRESQRRQGIGSLLLDSAIGAATSHGALEIYLEVRESNAAARAIYGSRGFEEIGRRRRYYRHPVEDAIILRRLGGARIGKAAPGVQ